MTKRKVGNWIGGLQDKSTQQTWVARQYRSPASLENCHVKKNSQVFQIPYKNAKTTICQMLQGFETHLVFFKVRTKISHPYQYPFWPSAKAAAGTGSKPLASSTDSIAALENSWSTYCRQLVWRYMKRILYDLIFPCLFQSKIFLSMSQRVGKTNSSQFFWQVSAGEWLSAKDFVIMWSWLTWCWGSTAVPEVWWLKVEY